MDKRPLVSIIMGSDSDLAVMQGAADVLARFAVPYEMDIVSAHRTPERAFEYARSAESRELEVIVAGAGGAAHLAGVVAALTCLPVIGVPVKSAALQGVDSLLSMVQMPTGIPVATVAINGGWNAGLLAAQILANKRPELRQLIRAYKDELRQNVETKAAQLRAGR